MEQRSGCGQEPAWTAGFQRIYLRNLVAVLRRARIDQSATTLAARGRGVKLAADLSLAMTARSRTAWRRAILGKFIFRVKKTRWQWRVVNSRRNSQGKMKSVSAKARPCKAANGVNCRNSCRQLPEPNSRLTAGTTSLLSRDNCDKEEGGSGDSRMQSLRALVPGSRRLDTPIFLKEAADYIVALKMQVRTMQALADCYSNSNADAACRVFE